MSGKLSAMLATALEYAERKFYVFPCWPRTKKPIPKNGFKAATIDVAKIETWWTENPDANIAIACAMSSIVVLDIDVPGAAHPDLKVSGEDTLAALADKLGRLPETVTAETGAGGRHHIRRVGTERVLRIHGRCPGLRGGSAVRVGRKRRIARMGTRRPRSIRSPPRWRSARGG